MSRFQSRKPRETPAISTASLPDIIFILLFFFMVVTVMREVTMRVQNRLPDGSELTKLERKSLVSTIYVGEPLDKERFGTAPRIQLNDKFATVDQIPAFVENERNSTAEDLRKLLTFSLQVDKKTKMGIVSDLKQELRKSDALKINYAAIPMADL